MRLPRLPAASMRANAFYFSEMGYEPEDIKRRVDEWLGGKEDREIHKKVLAWLRKDADWITYTLPYALRRYWYAAPLAFFFLWHTRRIWKQGIARLEKELQGGGSGVPMHWMGRGS